MTIESGLEPLRSLKDYVGPQKKKGVQKPLMKVYQIIDIARANIGKLRSLAEEGRFTEITGGTSGNSGDSQKSSRDVVSRDEVGGLTGLRVDGLAGSEIKRDVTMTISESANPQAMNVIPRPRSRRDRGSRGIYPDRFLHSLVPFGDSLGRNDRL